MAALANKQVFRAESYPAIVATVIFRTELVLLDSISHLILCSMDHLLLLQTVAGSHACASISACPQNRLALW